MRCRRPKPNASIRTRSPLVVNRYNLLILGLTNKEVHSARQNDFSVRKCTSDQAQSDHSSRNRKVTVPV